MARWAQISNDSPTVVDALDRGALVDRIADLVEDVQPPFTLGVYGGWGSGKSSIMKLVRRRLDPPRDGRPLPALPRGEPEPERASDDDLLWRRTVWFNAWEHQDDTDPAVALLQEARRMLRPSWPNRWRMRKWFKILRDALGPALTQAGPPVSVVGGPLTALRQSAERTNRDLFAVQEDQVRKREAFTEIVNLLARRADAGKNGRGEARQGRKIVIFVDDLDRCDDDEKAQRLLGDIKTYFDHPRCVFVVGVNSAKLRAQRDEVQRSRNQGDDAQPELHLGEDRLDKIISYPFYMPPLEKEQYDHFVMRMLKEKFGWDPDGSEGDSTTADPPAHRLDVPQVQKVSDILKEILASRSASVREMVRLCNVFVVNHELTSSSFGEAGLWGDYRPEVVAVLSAVQAFYPEAHEWLCSEQRSSTGPAGTSDMQRQLLVPSSARRANRTGASVVEAKLHWLFGGDDLPPEVLRGGGSLTGTQVLRQARDVHLVQGRERLPLYLSMWGHPHQDFARTGISGAAGTQAESRWDREYRARQDMDLAQKLQWIRSPKGHVKVIDAQGDVTDKLVWDPIDLRVVKLGDYWWWVVHEIGGQQEQQIVDLVRERDHINSKSKSGQERIGEIATEIDRLEEELAGLGGPRALLLSEGLVKIMQYDSEVLTLREWGDAKVGDGFKGALWSDSTLRKWLRTDFVSGLPEEVRERMLTVTTTTAVDWVGPGKVEDWDEKALSSQRHRAGADRPDELTDETIFLLRWEEVFTADSPHRLGEADVDARGPDGTIGFWWSRSPGKYPNNALAVLPSALVDPGSHYRNFWAGSLAGVRPAFWLNLKSKIF